MLVFKGEITSLAVMQRSLYIYVGDSVGNISVFKPDQEPCHIVQMKYTVPFSASHGNPTEAGGDTTVMHILPQPMAESKRIPKKFTEGKSAETWSFHCRWWLTRHFSKNMLASEIAAGDLPLLAYKVACASHMYGVELEYVVKAYDCLEKDKEKDRDMFLFLQKHMQNSVGFYFNST